MLKLTAPRLVWIAYTLVTLSTAVIRGGREVRIVAMVALIEVLALLANVPPAIRAHPAVDLAALLVCLGCVVTRPRYWAIWAAASVLLQLLTNVLTTYIGASRWTEAWAQVAWNFVWCTAILAGAITDPDPAFARRDKRQ
jgi:hypothetical protein